MTGVPSPDARPAESDAASPHGTAKQSLASAGLSAQAKRARRAASGRLQSPALGSGPLPRSQHASGTPLTSVAEPRQASASHVESGTLGLRHLLMAGAGPGPGHLRPPTVGSGGTYVGQGRTAGWAGSADGGVAGGPGSNGGSGGFPILQRLGDKEGLTNRPLLERRSEPVNVRERAATSSIQVRAGALFLAFLAGIHSTSNSGVCTPGCVDLEVISSSSPLPAISVAGFKDP
jgi:hypothetical protein